MIRTWISGFIKRHKEKFMKVAKITAMALIGILLIFSIGASLERLGPEEIKTNSVYKPSKSAVDGKNVSKEVFEEDENIINIFIGYCNDGDSENAYSLLSDVCKEQLYQTLEKFTENYQKQLFPSKREYNLQSWINDNSNITYRVRLLDDIISTGIYNGSEQGQDYITIIREGENKKININSYVKREEINKRTELDGIEIEAVRRDVYMEYEEYTLKVTNNTDKVIALDNLEKPSETIRLETDNNELGYKVYTNGLTRISLVVEEGRTKEIKIRFIKSYNLRDEQRDISFKNIIIDYNNYKELKENYEIKSLKIGV